MLSSDEIISGYRRLLHRMPESEAVVDLHRSHYQDIQSFEDGLRASAEYRQRSFISRDGLDEFISASDNIGPPNSPEVEAFWKGKNYRTAVEVDEDLDPFSDEYVAQQIAVYREISGREIDQQNNELTDFAFEEHAGAANPYAHLSPGGVAIHMGRIARALEYAGLSIGAHVLDMGCGWGATSELLAFSGLRVTALDINAKFVELVNTRAGRRGLPINSVCSSFERIPGDEQFDAALYYESLHHAVRPWETLTMVHDRLQPGGKLLLAGEPINGIWKNWGIRTDPLSVYCIRKFGWFESGWSEPFLRQCLERSGFAVEHFADEGGTVGWVVIAAKR